MLNKKIIFLSAVTFTLSTNTFAASGFTKPTFDLEMSAFSLKEEALLSRGAATSVEAHFNYLIEDDFKLNFWPVASFISGQQTSRDPQSPLTNSIYLKEASVEKEIGYLAKIKVGALYQKDFLSGIAGQTKSFPAVGLVAPLTIQKHLIEFKAEAAVPTSSGLATTTNELESNASLYTAGLFLNSKWTSNFQTQLNYSHFKFNNLSTQAGYDSLQRGNTVVKLNSSTGYFVYKFSGDEIQLTINYLLMDLVDTKLKTGFIKNSSAPTDLNSGYYITLAPGVRVNSKYVLRPQIDHYHVQSDAMVAVFSDTTYGRTNRDGYRYGLNIETEKYTLQMIFAHSKLIQKNPFQSSDTSTFINLDIKNINL